MTEKSRTRLAAGALSAGVFAALMTLGSDNTAEAAPAERWAAGRILVQPRAGLPESQFEQIVRLGRGQLRERIGRTEVRIISVPPQAEEAVARALARNPHIAFAEPDMLVPAADLIPNDPNYSKAWHLPKIGAPRAWESSLGDGVVVAILDTGVDGAHPDLAAKLLPGWNAVSSNRDTADVHGHGTAVAGTVGAESNNQLGVASVAWNTLLMPVRITNRSDGYAYWSDIARGLTWAADNGARVANISYGVTGSSAVSSAAQYMRQRGGLVVVAAGNESKDPGYAENTAMISVSATTSTDVKASWSNFGKFIDLSAPGASIMTTKRGGSYGAWSGTSFASPVVAGVAALTFAANPALTPDQVEGILEKSADDLGSAGWDPNFGYGRVNAARAVALATGNASTPGTADTQRPVVTIHSPAKGSKVGSKVTISASATDDTGVKQINVYVDGKLRCKASAPTISCVWDTRAETTGKHVIKVRGEDYAGNKGARSIAVYK